MKNVLTKMTCLMVSFLVLGCAGVPSAQKSSGTKKSSSRSSSSSSSSSVEEVHTHSWAKTWSYDQENHWHDCTGKNCEEKNDVAAHTFGNWQNVDVSTLKSDEQYLYAKDFKKRTCTACGYYELSGTNILPELRFTFDPNDPDADFMTKAKKNDLSRPEVKGKYTLTNCPDKSMEFADVAGTMKVRGNQTAGWRKKAFRVKFDKKRSMMGLNGGGKFKKWVLLADAKDTTLIRSAAGLYLSREVCKDEDYIWVCDYTPVTVYLNDQYWGYYYLGEQKEVKDDGDGNTRVKLPEVDEKYTGVDIGYCFELDHYADGAGTSDSSEVAKGKDGDPTFRMQYTPSMVQGRPSGPLATGQVHTYTMLSDITDGPMDAKGNPTEHFAADYSRVSNGGAPSNGATKTSNSAQLSFIRDKMEQLYQVLYNAVEVTDSRGNVINTPFASEINENGEVVASSKSIQEVIEQYFDIPSWVDCNIINAICCPPDLGYSSFYMSYDNTPTGDHKLRYDCPWDFDSNFGNRNNFYVNSQGDTYVENTYNTWIYLLNKLDFFVDAVKAKWNALREAEVFEGMFHMMRQYFTNYDLEIHRNHYKWPENDAASMTYNNFDEIRDPYKKPAQYKEAETETINWTAKRINYLESRWGTGRADINTNK